MDAIQRLLTIEEIKQLKARYFRYMDTKQFDRLAELFAPDLKAEVYVAAAENDRSYPPDMAERLEKTLTQFGVRYSTETYPAAHGWMKPDFPVYDRVAAERGWVEMLALFARNLRDAA